MGADIRTFRRKGGFDPPKRLSADEREEWERVVRNLRLVGTLRLVTPAAVLKYVRRSIRFRMLCIDRNRVNKVIRKLRRIAKRLESTEQESVLEAANRLDDLVVAQHDESQRLSRAMLRFLSAWGLTPLGRRRLREQGTID